MADKIFDKDLSGAVVSPQEEGYDKLFAAIMQDIQTATEMSTGWKTQEEVHAYMEKILGQPLDPSTTLLPPFYTDYGKQTKIGKNCFIQQACTFFGRCGITIGDGVLIGPKCNLITINHPEDPEERDGTYGAPIVLEDKVWLGINVTVLPGVTIGYGSIVGANSVVTKDVPPMTIVAGNPARIIRPVRSRQDK